jgi:hypothetical protein
MQSKVFLRDREKGDVAHKVKNAGGKTGLRRGKNDDD